MAELVDALGSGSSGSTPVQVRVLLRAQGKIIKAANLYEFAAFFVSRDQAAKCRISDFL